MSFQVKKFLLWTGTVALMLATAEGNGGRDDPVMAGYDLVAYHSLDPFDDGVPGRPEFQYRHDGYLYYFANEENKLTCQGTNASKKEEEKEFKVRNMRLTDCEREGESASKIFHEPSVALVDLRENDYEQSNMKDF